MKFCGEAIEEVESYIYLAQEMSMRNELSGEISGRRKAEWIKFREKEVSVVKFRIGKKNVSFNSGFLLVMLYGSESWSLI